MAVPASSASRSAASGKLKPSVNITNLKMSPFWPDEKSNQEPLWSLTKNEGVFSCLKGERPLSSRPARLSETRRPTTWLTGRRVRISSSREGGKRIELLGGCGPGLASHIRDSPASSSPDEKKAIRRDRFPQPTFTACEPAPAAAEGSGLALGQERLHQAARPAEIHAAGVACLQCRHHLAHVARAAGAHLRDQG